MKIRELEIFTSNIDQQKTFYGQVLGLTILNQDSNSFEVEVGFTSVKFLQKENATPYHIAIHAKDQQEKEALNWLKSRVEILKAGEDEIVDFSNWNAKSIYFYDKDQNIMELISRRNWFKAESSGFSSKDFVGVAEIGLAVSDISEKFQKLQEHCDLDIYDGNFEKFCAIGDDEGLLITIDKNQKDWFPTNDKAFGSGFRIRFENKGSSYEFLFEDDTLKIF